MKYFATILGSKLITEWKLIELIS